MILYKKAQDGTTLDYQQPVYVGQDTAIYSNPYSEKNYTNNPGTWVGGSVVGMADQVNRMWGLPFTAIGDPKRLLDKSYWTDEFLVDPEETAYRMKYGHSPNMDDDIVNMAYAGSDFLMGGASGRMAAKQGKHYMNKAKGWAQPLVDAVKPYADDAARQIPDWIRYAPAPAKGIAAGSAAVGGAYALD